MVEISQPDRAVVVYAHQRWEMTKTSGLKLCNSELK